MAKVKKKPTANSKKATKKRATKAGPFDKLKDPLVFVDTNILLDFYRARNSSGLSILDKIDTVRDKIISTYQVEMEFKKNRQSVFAEGMKGLQLESQAVSPPAYLSGHRSLKSAKNDIESAKSKIKKVKESHKLALGKPATHDKVYQACQRLFRSTESICLTRDNPDRRAIKKLALKRFVLGYPPRKKGDTSIGDAINWEWIIKVATLNSCDIIVVSRDSDFGYQLDSDAFINDWLLQEFRDRVGSSRKVILTQQLTAALSAIEIAVTKEESDAEEQLISSSPHRINFAMDPDDYSRINIPVSASDSLRKIMRERDQIDFYMKTQNAIQKIIQDEKDMKRLLEVEKSYKHLLD